MSTRWAATAAVVAGLAVGAVLPTGSTGPTPGSRCATSVSRYVAAYGTQPEVAVVNRYDGTSRYYALPHRADMVCNAARAN